MLWLYKSNYVFHETLAVTLIQGFIINYTGVHVYKMIVKYLNFQTISKKLKPAPSITLHELKIHLQTEN